MSYRKIQAALDTHMQGFGGIHVVYPSHPHRAVKDSSFLAVHFLPGSNKTVLLGPDAPAEYRGLYQIDVRVADVQAAFLKIDLLRRHFEKGLVLNFEGQDVILEKSEAGPNQGNLKHTKIPLSVHWRSYF